VGSQGIEIQLFIQMLPEMPNRKRMDVTSLVDSPIT